MKTKFSLSFLYIVLLLAACQTASPTPAMMNTEFTLSAGQSTTITRTGLTITFHSVLSDERCPIEIECAVSGPVMISLSIQQDGDTAATVSLETFTDQEGRAPSGSFEGIEDRIEIGDYLIQVVGVLPYPRNLSGIKPSDYQATFIVTEK
jgi:hypothetical protein